MKPAGRAGKGGIRGGLGRTVSGTGRLARQDGVTCSAVWEPKWGQPSRRSLTDRGLFRRGGESGARAQEQERPELEGPEQNRVVTTGGGGEEAVQLERRRRPPRSPATG